MPTGEEIFAANCAACHARGNNVIMPEKTLQSDAMSKYLAGGANVESIKKQVVNGKNAMPAFSGRINTTDVSAVSIYVFNQMNKWQ